MVKKPTVFILYLKLHIQVLYRHYIFEECLIYKKTYGNI